MSVGTGQRSQSWPWPLPPPLPQSLLGAKNGPFQCPEGPLCPPGLAFEAWPRLPLLWGSLLQTSFRCQFRSPCVPSYPGTSAPSGAPARHSLLFPFYPLKPSRSFGPSSSPPPPPQPSSPPPALPPQLQPSPPPPRTEPSPQPRPLSSSPPPPPSPPSSPAHSVLCLLGTQRMLIVGNTVQGFVTCHLVILLALWGSRSRAPVPLFRLSRARERGWAERLGRR